jgi:hypothetical protein
LFAVIHRREGLSATAFQGQLEAARAEVMRRGTRDVPETRHSRNLAKRFEAHGESYSLAIPVLPIISEGDRGVTSW